MRSRYSSIAAVATFVLATACAPRSTPPSTHPAPTAMMEVADRLFFGRGIPGGGEVPDSAWTSFVRDVITPRFPEGLTVWRAEGQWLDPRGTLVREQAIVVEIIHPTGQPADSAIASIAEEYRRRFRQDAVLRSSASVRTVLYTGAPR